MLNVEPLILDLKCFSSYAMFEMLILSFNMNDDFSDVYACYPPVCKHEKLVGSCRERGRRTDDTLSRSSGAEWTCCLRRPAWMTHTPALGGVWFALRYRIQNRNGYDRVWVWKV